MPPLKEPATDNERLRLTNSPDAHQIVTSESSTTPPSTLDVEEDASGTASTTSDNSSDASLGDNQESVGDGEETESGDEDENTGSENGSDAEDDNEEESSGDKIDDDNPGTTDQNHGSRLLGLSNELLTSIILNLDPPSAVCLGFTYKQLCRLVPIVCKTSDIWSVCPKWSDQRYYGWKSLLTGYTPKQFQLDRQAVSRLAFKSLQQLYRQSPDVNILLPDSLLSLERMELELRLGTDPPFDYYVFDGDYLCKISGHLPYPRDSTFRACLICQQTDYFASSSRVLQNDYMNSTQARGIEAAADLARLNDSGMLRRFRKVRRNE
jgi:hypothetical protein